MIDKLKNIITRYDELTIKLSQPDVVRNIEQFTQLSKEHSSLSGIVTKSKEYLSKIGQLKEDEEILKGNDYELKGLVQEEIKGLRLEISTLEEGVKVLLIPRDPDDDKNIILEIRGGTGGEEAALFAGDLYRMYVRCVERNNLSSEVISVNGSETGGIKEIIVSIKGKSAYSDLKFESGVHRVQRIPTTESSGRVHTSAATVAILPEPEKIDLQIKENDLKIDTYRASGSGGQHVNKTESAIRITHISTGVIVTCQDESSQLKNKEKAMKILRSRLYRKMQDKLAQERASVRKSMVSTGDRSAKIRTYNFPQNRVTDHRINLTLYKLDEILDGNLSELIESLKLEERKLKLADYNFNN